MARRHRGFAPEALDEETCEVEIGVARRSASPDMCGRLAARLLEGWVGDDDLKALARIVPTADGVVKDSVRKAATRVSLSGPGQRAGLTTLPEMS